MTWIWSNRQHKGLPAETTDDQSHSLFSDVWSWKLSPMNIKFLESTLPIGTIMQLVIFQPFFAKEFWKRVRLGLLMALQLVLQQV